VRLRADRNRLLEENTRLRIERDLLATQFAAQERIDSKRSQAPRHLPLPPAPLTEGPVAEPLTQLQAQRLTAEALAQMAHLRQMRDEPPLMPVISDSLQVAMRQMDAFICNCAPGRHELFVRPSPSDVERDYEALFGK
jgi:hypothetical protein